MDVPRPEIRTGQLNTIGQQVFCLLLAFLTIGCINLKQPAIKVDYYQIEYGPLNSPTSEPLDVVLGLRSFTIATAYDHDRIVYEEEAFKRQSYYHHRWVANPSAIIRNALLKDLQNSGCYRAVTLIPGSITWDYELHGHIHEIGEKDMGENWTAVIDLEITFIKAPAGRSVKKILFQKNYRHSATCEKKEPVAVVVAMSQAVKELSLELQKDIYKAIQNEMKLEEPQKASLDRSATKDH
jgi:ABC-type uncharacterized transport system auxiliary subunit